MVQLAACGIVTQAAKHIGASMEALYKLRHRPGAEEFAAAWDDAVDRGVQRLEDCALARAIAGESRLVVSGGKVLGTASSESSKSTMLRVSSSANSGMPSDRSTIWSTSVGDSEPAPG